MRSGVGLGARDGAGLGSTKDELAPPVELWATRALHRSRRHAGAERLDATARRLWGEHWLSGEEVGVHRAVVTKQGMLFDASTTD